MSAFDLLHAAVQYHVVNSLGWSTLRPTQLEAIAPIQGGEHCLLLAPTAGGKTEAAIIPILSRMLAEEWSGLSVLYICPIKALLNNLEPRLTRYAGLLGRSVEVWHGDISDTRKRRIRSSPPDVLLTTPESVEGMLVSTRTERESWFGGVRAIIVDELHAVASDDRGWHLRSVMARVDSYCRHPTQRLGLSATVSNPDELLAWFAPSGQRRVVGSSSVSADADVTIDAVGTVENAALVISRLHRGEKRLVFCDSRANAERIGAELLRAGIRTFVSHASLSVSERKQAEAAFTEERDCVIVATSTLELGIDVGDLDRVIQIDSPSTVSSFLQRMGRSGRRSGARRNCLFLTTNDTGLMTAAGICELWASGWVEKAEPPAEPWNVLAQQLLLMTLEHGQLARSELLSAIGKCFPELITERVTSVIDHLVSTGHLSDAGGVLSIGLTAEQEYGRAHYRDLMATFTGGNLLAARHGANEVGYLDPSVLQGDGDKVTVLLAGRSWDVRDIDWKKRIVWIEPTKEGGAARWTGSGREMSHELAQAIRRVLIAGTVKGVHLSKRGSEGLDDIRDQTPSSEAAEVVEALGGGRFRLWTFAGTLRNRTQFLRESQAGATKFDGLSIFYKTAEWSSARATNADADLPQSMQEVLLKAIKFSNLLDDALAERIVRSRRLAPASTEVPVHD
ncbi:ATP-dependent Lhr-like helicase [Panacagrimonas perspica]|uniref:ATP-dependent Lhr-like helicase n=1 Tax=Panacagrimonas perspica TaxID=381431 RepID=A0A4S3K3J7_9GAMM|nr:DEAD/DEAH box helicase [Panacagrimonas perspica]TDU23283.1 ATP-dependent Lhr-like helicase [Panacagrimonas perspica]THD02518.1 ATP-dependent helicase [Panacagrimonas perspica]